MKKIDALKDILQNKTANQIQYNHSIITNTNPELRQLYTQLRDDEMRSIVKLQQRISRLEMPGGMVTKIFPAKPKY